MSTLSVAKKDFTSSRRSPVLWAGAVGLGFVAVFVAFASGTRTGAGRELVQELFRTLTVVLSLLVPVVVLAATVLAIAGQRTGEIKLTLSLPNSRREVFVGTFLSRLGLVSGGVLFAYVAAIAVSTTRHGVLPAGVVFGTFVATLTYGATVASIGVSLSAAAASGSRAVAAAAGAYLVLVVLYFFPMVQPPALVRWAHTTVLDADPAPNLYDAVHYASPYVAYRKAVNLALPADLREPLLFSRLTADAGRRGAGDAAANAARDLPMYLTDEFSVVVLAFWLLLALFVGRRVFEGADLK